MVYGLRIYNCVLGRMPDVLARFESAALGFFRSMRSSMRAGPCASGSPASRSIIFSAGVRSPIGKRSGPPCREMRTG